MEASSVQDTPDELELMRQRLAELEAKQKNVSEEVNTDRRSPFKEDILAKPLPEKLKMPQLTSYEDGNDPVGHLDKVYLLDGTPRSQRCYHVQGIPPYLQGIER
ncbi:Uncharacterized protein Adt_12262 [Abeliophyllum distichum]|uniref:Uncharacterized protein n=1 Tax=Abeliophyllum distichum TaxID=126358 RepID=A0ABD1US01_9LAMI